MEIVLAPELEILVNQKIASGVYGSPSEVVNDSLRLLQDRDELERIRLEELRQAIMVGVAESRRGESVPLDMDAIIADVKKRLESKK